MKKTEAGRKIWQTPVIIKEKMQKIICLGDVLDEGSEAVQYRSLDRAGQNL